MVWTERDNLAAIAKFRIADKARIYPTRYRKRLGPKEAKLAAARDNFRLNGDRQGNKRDRRRNQLGNRWNTTMSHPQHVRIPLDDRKDRNGAQSTKEEGKRRKML